MPNLPLCHWFSQLFNLRALSSTDVSVLLLNQRNRLMWMCSWMGSHFHGWIDYNGVVFSLELLGWDRTFSGIRGSENSGR